MKNTVKQAGFTLVELAIVLVIIGLIVGGVLVGQDLIKAAEVRATIGQVEKYDTAVNTFRGKYNGLPGDISTAANFGLSTTGRGTATANGLINRGDDTTTDDLAAESALFFRDLAQANMISESITNTTGTKADVDTIATTVPLSKVGRGNYIIAYTDDSINVFGIAGSSVADGDVTFSDAITPIEAFQIDSKMDDGKQSSGVVQSMDSFTTVATDDGGDANNECTDGTEYYTDSATRALMTACKLRIRASF